MFDMLADLTAAEILAAQELLFGVPRKRVEDTASKIRPGRIKVADLLKSATAKSRKINNAPDSIEVAQNLERLAEFLNKLESRHGIVDITSGYRSSRLNQAVGGSTRSVHMSGRAADIRVHGMTNIQVANALIDLGADKVILESLSRSGWTHVEIPKAGKKPRGRKVTAYKSRYRGKTKYVLGFKPHLGIYATA